MHINVENNSRNILKSVILSLAMSLIIFSPTAFSTQAPGSLNCAMSDIGEIMVEIYPLIVAKRELSAEETQKSVACASARPLWKQNPEGMQKHQRSFSAGRGGRI